MSIEQKLKTAVNLLSIALDLGDMKRAKEMQKVVAALTDQI